MSSRNTQTQDSYWRGIFQRESPRSQEAGWQPEALNVQFRGGACQGRPGIRPISGVAFSDNIYGIHWHVKEDGTRQLLAAVGAGFQRCGFNGDPIDMPLTWLPLVDQVRTLQQRVWFLSLSSGLSQTFIYDGVNQNLKWDGTKLTKMGLPNGPEPPVPTPGAGDILPGTRKYIMTLKTLTHEGDTTLLENARVVTNATNASQIFASPTQVLDPLGTPESIRDAEIANSFDDPQVTKWALYRTTSSADITGGFFFYVGEADIGTPIIDNRTDIDLEGEVKAEQLVNSYPMAPITVMCEHRGQLVAVMSDHPSVLRFSHYDTMYMVPEGWPRSQAMPVAPGDGDLLTALASFNDWLVVFKSNATYAVTGEVYEEYKLVPVLASGTRQGIGCAYPGSVLHIENSLHFASRDGIYRIDRSGNLQSRRISSAIDELYSGVNFSLGSATFFDRKKRLFWWGAHG